MSVDPRGNRQSDLLPSSGQQGVGEELRRFRQIAERINDIFYVVETATGRPVYVSPAFERIWGRSVAAMLADPSVWLEWVHPDDRDRVAAAAEITRDRGIPFEQEYRLVRPDGSIRTLRARTFPGGAEDRDYVIGVAQDITDELAMQEALRQAHKMEAVGALASGIAHDFNNLLMAISGCVDAALDALDPDHPAYAAIRKAQQTAARGTRLTQRLTSFARKRAPLIEPLEIDPIVTAAAELLRRLVGAHIRVRVHTGADGAIVRADAADIEQLLLNLASNARDAMEEGGDLTITTEWIDRTGEEELPRSSFVVVSVSDTGCGIDPPTRARIFEPFFTTKEIGRGTGLGLSIVHETMSRFGGFIEVESEVGAGTRFSLYFPLHDHALAPQGL
jgi:PAS domain S-box-containing protein